MAVPDYQTRMLPLLKALGGGEVRRLFPEVGPGRCDEVGRGPSGP